MAQHNHMQDAYQSEGSDMGFDDDFDFGADLSTVDETDRFSPIPAGRYTLMATNIELKDSNGGKMVAVKFQVTDGPHTGRLVFENFNLQHQNRQTVEIAVRDAKRWIIACGMDANQRLTMGLLRQLEGIEFPAHIGIEVDKKKKYADRNRIRRYESTTDDRPAAQVREPTQPAARPQQDAAPKRQPAAPASGKRPWE
jgi:hypothetical protein